MLKIFKLTVSVLLIVYVIFWLSAKPTQSDKARSVNSQLDAITRFNWELEKLILDQQAIDHVASDSQQKTLERIEEKLDKLLPSGAKPVTPTITPAGAPVQESIQSYEVYPTNLPGTTPTAPRYYQGPVRRAIPSQIYRAPNCSSGVCY